MNKMLNKKDKEKLDKLNLKVENAVKERKEWMDSKMEEYANMQVDEEIYNLLTGERLGIITKLYRYWANQDVYKDKFFEIHYQYRTSKYCYDNTSRQHGIVFGNKEKLIERMEYNLKKIKS